MSTLKISLSILFLWLPTVCLAMTARVISLAPDATEMAFAAGMGSQLIAVSEYSDYPVAAKNMPRVATWQSINIEKIIQLKPDLILAWRSGNPTRPLEQLQKLGFKILYLDASSLQNIIQNLHKLIPFSHNPKQAQQTIDHLTKILNQLLHKKHTSPAYKIFIQFGTFPLYTAAGNTLQSKVIELCGGDNIFSDSLISWPQVSKEQVIQRHPQLIVVPGNHESARNVKNFWGDLLNIPIITVQEDWFNRSSPRIFLAAEQICQKLSQQPVLRSEK